MRGLYDELLGKEDHDVVYVWISEYVLDHNKNIIGAQSCILENEGDIWFLFCLAVATLHNVCKKLASNAEER